MNRWFRFYEQAINDDKVRGLSSDTLRWQWVTLLTVASKYEGCIPSLKIAADNMRVKEAKAAQIIGALAVAGLLDADNDGYFRAHNWEGRQPTDATAAERQRRKRQKDRDADRDKRDIDTVTTVTVTPLEEEREKEEETERKKESESAALRAPPPDVSRETISQKSKRAKARSSLADDWKPSERDLAHATERGFDATQAAAMAAGFSNHHRARGNLMADWGAAWRTWCDNEIKFQRSNVYGPGRQRSLQDDSLSVSKAIDRRLATPGTLVFPPRPTLLPIEREDDRRLLPAGRSAES